MEYPGQEKNMTELPGKKRKPKKSNRLVLKTNTIKKALHLQGFSFNLCIKVRFV